MHQAASHQLHHVMGRASYHQSSQEDHQADQQRFARTDPIADPAADHGSEEHSDQKQGERPGVVRQTIKIMSGHWHCSRDRDGLERDGHNRGAQADRECALGDLRDRDLTVAGAVCSAISPVHHTCLCSLAPKRARRAAGRRSQSQSRQFDSRCDWSGGHLSRLATVSQQPSPGAQTIVDERTQERPDSRVEEGDHERFSHYVPKDKLTEAMVMGTPVVALCGKVWVPSRDPERFPVCPECKEIWESLEPGGDEN